MQCSACIKTLLCKQEESYKKTWRQVDIGMNVNKNKSECNIKASCLSFKTFQKFLVFTPIVPFSHKRKHQVAPTTTHRP